VSVRPGGQLEQQVQARLRPAYAALGKAPDSVRMTGLEECARELGHALACAGEYGNRAGLRSRASPSIQVVGEDGTQPWFSARLGVAELVELRGLGGGPDRLHPFLPRKSPKVGLALGQVETYRPGRRALVLAHLMDDPAIVGRGRPAHPGRGAGASSQIPLGNELAVRPGHRPAGYPEICRACKGPGLVAERYSQEL
jgi:hypothetical protein